MNLVVFQFPFHSELSRLETYASRLVAQQCEQIDVCGDAINLTLSTTCTDHPPQPCPSYCPHHVYLFTHTHFSFLYNWTACICPLWICLQMDWNQSALDTLGCSGWQRAKTHRALKMLWVWLQLLAFVTQLVLSLFTPISFPLYLGSLSVYVPLLFFFVSNSLPFQRAPLASDLSLSARASCLTLLLSPSVCAR